MRERMTPIFNGRVLALALGLAACGCSGAARLDQDQQLATPTSTALRAGDWIKVTVAGDASLSGDFQIDPTGYQGGRHDAERARPGPGEEVSRRIREKSQRHGFRPARRVVI
jgi:hypothetical protein